MTLHLGPRHRRRGTLPGRRLLPALALAASLVSACTSASPAPAPESPATAEQTTSSGPAPTSAPPTTQEPAGPELPEAAAAVPDPIEPGVHREIGTGDGAVIRTDYSEFLAADWQWTDGSRMQRAGDGQRWYEFPDGSGATFSSAGVAHIDSDGNQTQCTWDGNCPDFDTAWATRPDLEHPSVHRVWSGGSITGDPHVTTAEGERFSTELAGEFIARTGDPGHDLQVRFTPVPDREDISRMSAVAIGTTGHRITVTSHPRAEVRIDGEVYTFDEPFRQIDLSDGTAVGIWESGNRDDLTPREPTVAVLWPDLGDVHLTVSELYGITLQTAWTSGASARGLLHRGTASDGSFQRRSGGQTIESSIFAESWRVAGSESLFDYEQGESTLGFTLLDFPTQPLQRIPGSLAEADAACTAAGYADQAGLEACRQDITTTGDPGFVLGHQAVAVAESALASDDRVRFWLERQRTGFTGADPDTLPQDLTTAEPIVYGASLNITLPTGGMWVGELMVPAATTAPVVLQIRSERDCSDPSTAGYQLLDAAGRPLAAPASACAATSTVVPAGRVYLVLVGPSAGGGTDFALRIGG